ncbi:hypothetical protein FIV42_04075 [Persicimonas caeni]|uniref:EcxA zinc-binding domain-containing protein n=1 Tax=Persicimonas caeni TaxID=2292766 RepID=A0A4Y6PNS4_PERCE|nr:zinc-dependent metalloprotease [Persicimonas caeni]QDG49944.1 hypothetical protein FIV42_04075 [Persicimonas caeni]QED31165.1 hypothetical protein FRD00_04070 [Persicimonas caeni]
MRRIGGWSMAASLVAAACVGTLGAGCAQDVGDIDRTQPDKLEKKMFQTDDEWYYRQTVIDTDMQGSMIFEALESPLKRVRFEVEKDVLYAYSTVPLAEGLQDDYTSEEDRRLGAVAAFPVTSHFDVQRQYNPSTGEQTNVIVENASDRAWYDRDYMRVNWSANLVDGRGMFANNFGMFSPVAHYETEDPREVDPDRVRISEDVIDVTTQYTFQPDIMACAYNIGALDTIWNCEAGKVRVRHSFIRIKDDEKTDWDDTNDYEPFMLTDNHRISKDGDPEKGAMYTTTVYDPASQFYMEVECDDYTKDFLRNEYGSTDENCQPATFDLFSRFGYFRTERLRWSEEYPDMDSDRLYYANRWNIWQTAYDADGTWIPLNERTPQPIVYHLNAEYPRDMIGAAKEVENQWNNVFLETVRIAKGYDSVDKVKEELTAEYGDDRMYKIVENSCMPGPLAQWRAEYGGTRDADRKSISAIFGDYVSATDGDALVDELWALPKQDRVQLCAHLEWATERRGEEARFSWERVGDLRYSFFNWVDEFNGYWSGYGPSAADPLTGEIISGNANFAGTPLRRYATSYTDIIQYINGDLSENDVRYGEHVRQYLQRLRNQQREQSLEPNLPAEAQRELARRTGQLPSEVSPTNFDEPPTLAEQDDFIKKWGKDRIMKEANRLSEAAVEAKKADTRLIEFYDLPEVKNLMMQDADFQMAVKALARDYFGPEPDEQEMHQAYLELSVPQDILRRSNRFSQMLAEQNIFAAENMGRALSSLVTYSGVAEGFKGEDREDIRRYLMENAFIGTQLHEVGHTVGLRHNFSASMDALNYHDAYWEIKKALLDGEFDGNTEGVTLGANGAVHITNPELVERFTGDPDAKYVSTPELRLGSIMDYTGDLTGRFAGLGKYDEAAIVFTYGEHVQRWKDDIELPNLLWYEEWTRDYTQLPSIYANRPSSTDPAVQSQGIDVMLEGREWVPIKAAIAEQREGIKTNSQNWAAGELSRNNKPYIDRTVPFNFCSDDFRDSQLGCDVFDWGANQTEVVNHAFNTYRFFQPFWRYKGHKNDRLFNLYNNYIRRVMSTFQMAERPFRYYSIYQWWDLGSYTDDLQKASIDALNFYAEVLATPQPNRYCKWDGDSRRVSNEIPLQNWYYDLDGQFVPNSWHTDETNCPEYVDIPRGPGQFYGFDFTDEYEYRIRRVGTYIDKSLATQALFNISANYAYSSFFTDARATNISYWTLFEEELLGFMRGVILGDYTGFAGRWDSQKSRYEPPVVVDINTFGTGLAPTQSSSDTIYTPVSFNQEFNTVAFGMLLNSSWEDRAVNFSNYLKVIVTNDEDQPFPNGVDVAELVHPITGQMYRAPQTNDNQSIAYDLIERGNELKTKWMDAQMVLENETPGTDAYEDAWKEERGYEQAFEEIVAKLDMIRYVFDAGRIQR